MRLVLTLIAMAAIAMVVSSGCGVSTSSDATTSSGVPLPGKTETTHQERAKFFKQYYRGLLATGTKVSVARCYKRHVEKLSPSFLNELEAHKVSPKREASFGRGLEALCIPAGTSAAKVNRSAAQIERTRKLLKTGIARGLEEKGAPLAEIECSEQEIEALSMSELKLMTSNNSEGEKIGYSIYTKCKDAE
jgi:hypothetical protein